MTRVQVQQQFQSHVAVFVRLPEVDSLNRHPHGFLHLVTDKESSLLPTKHLASTFPFPVTAAAPDPPKEISLNNGKKGGKTGDCPQHRGGRGRGQFRHSIYTRRSRPFPEEQERYCSSMSGVASPAGVDSIMGLGEARVVGVRPLRVGVRPGVSCCCSMRCLAHCSAMRFQSAIDGLPVVLHRRRHARA